MRRAPTAGGGTDRGVTNAVSIVLLVAIAVVLTTVIGVQFVAGYGDPTDVPRVSFGTETGPVGGGDYDVTLAHQSGSTVAMDQLRVVGSQSGELTSSLEGDDGDGYLEAGERLVTTVEAGETVRVYWHTDDGAESYELAVVRVPE